MHLTKNQYYFDSFSLWRAAGTSSGTEGCNHLTVCKPNSENTCNASLQSRVAVM